MNLDRRTFIRSSVTAGAALLVAPQTSHAMKNAVPLPANFKVLVMATNWGFEGTFDQFADKAKRAGYDGVEIVWPADETHRKEVFDAVKKYALDFAFLVGVWDTDDYTTHLKRFETLLRDAVASKPRYVNCHAGRDHFSFEQNKAFIDLTAKLHKESGIPIYHETHRGRILYSTPIAKGFIDKIPDLRLTLDISHWCAVHESLLADQSASVEAALSRTDHIHARIGHPEGPQVNDPRAPEWKQAVDAHLAWWDRVVKYKVEAGSTTLTFLTEFGPPDYLPTIPYTRQPVANQWDINVYILQLLKARYK